MIQPISAVTPQIGHRGSRRAYERKNDSLNESHVALINASGIAAVAGGLTTLVARSYTNSFASAGVLGVFGGLLTMFFMTPHLINKIYSAKAVAPVVNDISSVKPKVSSVVKKECLTPIKKLVQFRSDQV